MPFALRSGEYERASALCASPESDKKQQHRLVLKHNTCALFVIEAVERDYNSIAFGKAVPQFTSAP